MLIPHFTMTALRRWGSLCITITQYKVVVFYYYYFFIFFTQYKVTRNDICLLHWNWVQSCDIYLCYLTSIVILIFQLLIQLVLINAAAFDNTGKYLKAFYTELLFSEILFTAFKGR